MAIPSLNFPIVRLGDLAIENLTVFAFQSLNDPITQ
jgi:hypothetical protein